MSMERRSFIAALGGALAVVKAAEVAAKETASELPGPSATVPEMTDYEKWKDWNAKHGRCMFNGFCSGYFTASPQFWSEMEHRR